MKNPTQASIHIHLRLDGSSGVACSIFDSPFACDPEGSTKNIQDESGNEQSVEDMLLQNLLCRWLIFSIVDEERFPIDPLPTVNWQFQY